METLDYVVLLPAVERCLARVDGRKDHGFRDAGATRTMHRAFAEADIAERHLLIDPPDDPNDTAELVSAALDRGALRYGFTDVGRWAPGDSNPEPAD